jgi:hypothetical protein
MDSSTLLEAQTLVARFLDALAQGKLQPLPQRRLEPQLIGRGWRWVAAMVESGSRHEKLVPLARMLHRADPEFEAANLLLGLAYQVNGDLENARCHFTAQTRIAGEHAEAAKRLIGLLPLNPGGLGHD